MDERDEMSRSGAISLRCLLWAHIVLCRIVLCFLVRLGLLNGLWVLIGIANR